MALAKIVNGCRELLANMLRPASFEIEDADLSVAIVERDCGDQKKTAVVGVQATAILRFHPDSNGVVDVREERIRIGPKSEMVLIQDICAAFPISAKKIRKLCISQQVKASKRSGIWFVDYESFRAYWEGVDRNKHGKLSKSGRPT